MAATARLNTGNSFLVCVLQPDNLAKLRVGAKLGVKLNFFYVKCTNNVAGLILPSEGYSRW